MYTVLLILFAAFPLLAHSITLPSYIKRCDRKDPNFDKCALKSGKEAIKHLVYGEKSLRVPPLSPFKIPFIQLESSSSLQLNMTNVELLGLENAELVDVHADFNAQHVTIKLHAEEVWLNGDYHVNGRILILPIQGEGKGLVKLLGGDYTYGFSYSLYNKKGVKYAKLEKNDFSFDVKKASFKLENLFNGDKRLGDQMNRFINENWELILTEFKQVIGYTMAKICEQISKKVYEILPYDEVFLNN